jgi:hypothetical protein
MRFRLIRRLCVLAAGGLLAALACQPAFGQADALVEMLQKKGLLTQREANEVREQMFTDIREQMPATKMNIGSWLDELKLYGDARVRYESFFGRTRTATLALAPEVDRNRFRYRLRFGLAAKMGDWGAGFRLASGDSDDASADAISTNTTFDTFASKKPINVDLAYITYEPNPIPGLILTGGKIELPYWESDLVFDSDLTPEGFAETYNYKFRDEYAVWGTASQWLLAEDNTTANNTASSRGDDAYMFGVQLGHSWKAIPKILEIKQAVGYYDYVGLEDQTTGGVFAGAVIRNSLALSGSGSTTWLKDYNLLAINNEVKVGYFAKLPITLYGEYLNNLAATEFEEGWKVGFKLWNAKSKGQYEIGYWYEELEADANVLFSDSDFGNGGTNNKGHILKAKYNLTDYAQIGFAYYYVENIEDYVRASPATPDAGTSGNNQQQQVNRIQADIVLKF